MAIIRITPRTRRARASGGWRRQSQRQRQSWRQSRQMFATWHFQPMAAPQWCCKQVVVLIRAASATNRGFPKPNSLFREWHPDGFHHSKRLRLHSRFRPYSQAYISELPPNILGFLAAWSLFEPCQALCTASIGGSAGCKKQYAATWTAFLKGNLGGWVGFRAPIWP